MDVFAMRVSCLYGMAETMKYEQYSNEVTPSEIYVMEEKETEKQRVFILSAFPEFLLDYFGVKLWKTSVRHTRNRRNRLECGRKLFLETGNQEHFRTNEGESKL